MMPDNVTRFKFTVLLRNLPDPCVACLARLVRPPTVLRMTNHNFESNHATPVMKQPIKCNFLTFSKMQFEGKHHS